MVIFLYYKLAFVTKVVYSGVYFTSAKYCGNILYEKTIIAKMTSNLSGVQHLFGTLQKHPSILKC